MLAGCGGGGLSHDAFIKRADAVCAAYQAKAKPAPDPKSYEEVASYADTNLPLYDAALKQLGALHPPKVDARNAKLWIAADKRVAGALRALGVAALRHNFPGVTDATASLQVASLQSAKNASAIGMQVCGRLAP